MHNSFVKAISPQWSSLFGVYGHEWVNPFVLAVSLRIRPLDAMIISKNSMRIKHEFVTQRKFSSLRFKK